MAPINSSARITVTREGVETSGPTGRSFQRFGPAPVSRRRFIQAIAIAAATLAAGKVSSSEVYVPPEDMSDRAIKAEIKVLEENLGEYKIEKEKMQEVFDGTVESYSTILNEIKVDDQILREDINRITSLYNELARRDRYFSCPEGSYQYWEDKTRAWELVMPVEAWRSLANDGGSGWAETWRIKYGTIRDEWHGIFEMLDQIKDEMAEIQGEYLRGPQTNQEYRRTWENYRRLERVRDNLVSRLRSLESEGRLTSYSQERLEREYYRLWNLMDPRYSELSPNASREYAESLQRDGIFSKAA